MYKHVRIQVLSIFAYTYVYTIYIHPYPGDCMRYMYSRMYIYNVFVYIPILRTVCVRQGVVLSNKGGILAKLAPLFNLGGGGNIGSGCVYIYVCLNVYVYIYICIYIYMYMYIYIHGGIELSSLPCLI
jgi:hypothetical protein